MDTKKWRVLVTAVDLGSFSKAAELLGCTQSGLTHMMNTLEQEMGVKLLIRGFDGIRLTSDGEKLLPYIRAFLRDGTELERAAGELGGGKQQEEKTLRVACYTSMRLEWLPGILRLFSERHPDVRVDARDGSVDEVFSLVENGLVDVGMASRQTPMHCGWIPLADDPLRVVVPADYPAEQGADGQDFIPLTDLGGKTFLMPSLGFDRDIMRALNRPKFKPIIRTTLVDDASVVRMVENHEGVTMLSELVLRAITGNFRALPTDPAFSRELGIAVPSLKNLNPVTRDFIACAQQYLKG